MISVADGPGARQEQFEQALAFEEGFTPASVLPDVATSHDPINNEYILAERARLGLGVEYDVIGLSFYPWSHGTLLDLRDNLHASALRYNKPIILVETGYHFQPSRYFEEIVPPFPETPEGQRQWLEAVNEIVMNTPNGLGRGIFWWEPMMRGRGYFDADGNALTALLDAQFSHSANQLNVTMRTMTAWSIILMSMALIAGIYGMNFDWMPELHWQVGYFLSLLLMAGIGLGLLAFFRSRKWL